MNEAHLHLILIHFPIAITPIAAALFVAGFFAKNKALTTFSNLLLVIGSVIGVAAFLSGEGAEDVAEKVAGVIKSTIEDHEEAAEIAIWLISLSGIASLGYLLADKFSFCSSQKLIIPALALSILSSATLLYTGFEGGKIRHTEAYGQSQVDSHRESKDEDNELSRT